MTEIQPLGIDQFAEAARAAMEGRPPANLFRTIAHAPTMLPAFLLLGDALLHELDLDVALREFSIVRVAALTQCDYVLHHHRGLMAAMQIPDRQIAAAAGEESLENLGSLQRLVSEYTEAVVRDVQAPAQLAGAVRQELGDRCFVELTLVIGFYLMVSRVVRNAGVQIENEEFSSSVAR